MIDRKSVAAAAARIGPNVRHTPVLQGDLGIGAPVAMKLELLQHTGSFKPRGAFNRLLTAALPAGGVVAASGGNHGAAVAYAARSPGHHGGNLRPRRHARGQGRSDRRLRRPCGTRSATAMPRH